MNNSKDHAALTDWSIDMIISLLDRHVFEDESFDFKQALPDSKDEEGKSRIRKLCAALANSEGGFIVFGVSDGRGMTSLERLMGVDPQIDFPERFGNFPRACVPSVRWNFRNPPLKAASGRLIHVVYIPKSWHAPHAIDLSDGRWTFPKRTNKGTESMNIDEVRSGFLGLYEKRLKLQLLKTELLSIKEDAALCYVSDVNKIADSYQLVSFDTAVVDSVIADTYSVTANYPDLLSHLSKVRQITRLANNKINQFLQAAIFARSDDEKLTRQHNQFLAKYAAEIIRHCDAAMSQLDTVLVG
jgi:hypothetical protein